MINKVAMNSRLDKDRYFIKQCSLSNGILLFLLTDHPLNWTRNANEQVARWQGGRVTGIYLGFCPLRLCDPATLLPGYG
jgi:hypothetical protein